MVLYLFQTQKFFPLNTFTYYVILSSKKYHLSVILLPFLISILYFYDFATFSYFNTIFLWFCYLFSFAFYRFFRKGSKMYDMIWYWLNFWLNPLRVSPLVGGRWVFRFPFSFFSCASRTGTSLENGPGSTGRVRVSDPWRGKGRGGASDRRIFRSGRSPWITICGPVRQPAADQRDCRPWPPLQGKAQWIKLIRCLSTMQEVHEVWRF